jgi:glucose-1-phosphate thymidylyltransferase
VPTYAFPFDDAWFDIGEPEAYLETVAFHLDGDAKVASGATVTDSEIGENVLILEDAKVTDASLAETVVFSGAEITGATLEGSIVDEEAVVDGIDLSGSLVGAYTRLSD